MDKAVIVDRETGKRYIVSKRTVPFNRFLLPMMKRLFSCVSVFACLALLPFASGFAADPAVLSVPVVQPPSGPQGFALYHFEKHSEINGETRLSCDYPVFDASPAGDLINKTTLNAIVGVIPAPESAPARLTLEDATTLYLGEYEKVRTSNKAYIYTWEAMITGEVLLDRQTLVTVSIDSYVFTGGAHGMTKTQQLVFDAATGKQLVLADFFSPGFESALDQLIERRFRQMKGLTPTEVLNGQKGGLFENAIHHNENFAVTGSGIRFVYNQYEIAPYVVGQIIIDLSFDDLKRVLKPLPEFK